MNDFIYFQENWNTMEIEKIKDILNKEKPMAKLIGKDKKEVTYKTKLQNGFKVLFKIPIEEYVNFSSEEPSQTLIKWLKNK